MAHNDVDWYDTPRWYDMVFAEGTEREADFLEAALARHGPRRAPRRAYEPACGSGRLVVELARRGWDVEGSDRSAPMLAHARARLDELGLNARLVTADMTRHRPRPAVSLAHCLVSTFKYIDSEEGARRHLEQVAAGLRRGGLYVLGLHLTEYGDDRRSRERWVAERGPTRVVANIQTWPADRRRRTEAVRSRLVVEEGGRTIRTETRWSFRTYSARQLRRLLASVPALELVAVHDFDLDPEREVPLDGERLDRVLVLRRRA